jgi:hypothetical protein
LHTSKTSAPSGGETWVRSAYPTSITYGEISINLYLSDDGEFGTDGRLRLDNPKTVGNNPAPKVVENRKLDAIEIQANGERIRKYVLEYSVTSSYSSADYGGIQYSGRMILEKIQQYGRSDNDYLPDTEFFYENKPVYRSTSETQYVGNPGNPAEISWPYLVEIENGYGGSVYYEYTQRPELPVMDVWTRQVVVEKIVTSGETIALEEHYSYLGEPRYSGTGWDQEYRGFDQCQCL